MYGNLFYLLHILNLSGANRFRLIIRYTTVVEEFWFFLVPCFRIIAVYEITFQMRESDPAPGTK